MFDRLIAPNAEPIGHIPPYKRFDPNHISRKTVLDYADIEALGSRGIDEGIYRYHPWNDTWVLKDGI